MFTEHRIPRRPPAPPRPAWMDTDVVDPAWMKAHPSPASAGNDDYDYPHTIVGDGLDKAVDLAFNPRPKQKLVRHESDELVEARGILGDELVEVLDDVPLPAGKAQDIRKLVDGAIDRFMDKLQTILKGVVYEATTDDELINWQDVISGVMQQVKDGHVDAGHICREDLLDAALAEMDTREVEELVERLTDHLKFDHHHQYR